jgi:hypothetical protein
MEDVRRETKLHYEEKTGENGIVKTLKDLDGNVKFIKVGFNSWKKVTVQGE